MSPWTIVAQGCCLLFVAVAAGGADAPVRADSAALAALESLYADVSDANTILATIDSGLVTRYQGRDRAAWAKAYADQRRRLAERLDGFRDAGLTERDAKALMAMREQLKSFSDGAAPGASANCQDAPRKDLSLEKLERALVACFVELGNHLKVADGEINRVSALDMLTTESDAHRRKAVFMAFVPLWRAINGDDEPDSPYRRMIAAAAAASAQSGSEIDHAARDVGVDPTEVEDWLVRILEGWRGASDGRMVEPWDFRFETGEADRLLGTSIPRASLQPLNQRYYRDLGVDLEGMGTLYDLEPRPDKAALAYTEFVTHGRMVHGRWQPTIARVSAPYERGGLFVLNELIHESGHVVNITAIRNRPAFVYWPSDLFAEAFADVPAWSTYEPAWQQRYLGHAAPAQLSLRALYGAVVLDVCWSVFELRMLRAPTTDPNLLWTDITSRYLRIAPHPELAWWAVRVQLADLPGYMANYGVGAILTAQMRKHIAEALGPFDTGDRRWYQWLSDHLLRYGSERDTRALMESFLGRPVSPQALLEQIRRMRPAPTSHAWQSARRSVRAMSCRRHR